MISKNQLLYVSFGALLIIAAYICLTPQFNKESGPGRHEMSKGQAIVLGIVEGLTEYLPVSSTGHLLLTERIMGIGEGQGTLSVSERQRDKEAADAYAICIQAGAIIAVLGLYFRRVMQMLRGLLGRDPAGLRLLICVAAGFLPAAVLGLLFNKHIKEYLFGPWPVVAAWLVGGLAILAVSYRNATTGLYAQEARSMILPGKWPLSSALPSASPCGRESAAVW